MGGVPKKQKSLKSELGLGVAAEASELELEVAEETSELERGAVLSILCTINEAVVAIWLLVLQYAWTVEPHERVLALGFDGLAQQGLCGGCESDGVAWAGCDSA